MSKKYDWVQLKAEYMTGDEPVLTKFFRSKEIPEGTYKARVAGWRAERIQHRSNIHTESLAKDREARIIALGQLREFQSTVVKGNYALWQEMFAVVRKELQRLRGNIEKAHANNQAPDAGDYRRVIQLYKELMDSIPPHVKTHELLAGRATERNIAEDEATQERAEDLRQDFKAIRDRFAKLESRKKGKRSGKKKKKAQKKIS